jgi:hypothetical protein
MTEALLSELTEDGDVVDLGEGNSLRLKIKPDECTTINDFEYMGRIEWSRGHWEGSVRPDGFDGLSRIIDRDRQSALWWQPWEGCTEAEAKANEARIKQLCEYGYSLVTVELLNGKDGYGRPIVTDVASLGGIDFTGSYSECQEQLADILSELVIELGIVAALTVAS